MIKHEYVNYATEKWVLSEPIQARGGEHSLSSVHSTFNDPGADIIRIVSNNIKGFKIMFGLQEYDNE